MRDAAHALKELHQSKFKGFHLNVEFKASKVQSSQPQEKLKSSSVEKKS